ncbi:LPD7 domain-containing protein, partial [Pseudomonas syringae group genomosp. 3]
ANSQKLRRKSLTDQFKATREAIRTSGLDGNQRKALTSVATFTVAAKRDELKAIIKAEHTSFKKEKCPCYRDWVTDRASAGDPAAIAQLRGFAYADKRKGKRQEEPNITDVKQPYFAATSDSDLDPARPARLSERVTWAVDRSTGAVNYSVNDRLAFRDEGQRITFNKDSRNDADSIELGLLLAKEKFGAVAVHGGQEFRDRVLVTSVERRLDVRFADPELEQQRKDAIKADIDQARQRFIEDQQQVGVIRAQHEAKKAPRQAAMTRDEAQQALSAPAPVRPVRDYVEMDAVEADVAQYRSRLDRTHLESWGKRPDPEKAGGFIGRHVAKVKAMQWDNDFGKNVERPSEARRDHLNSDHPDAIKLRDDAWSQALKTRDSSVNAWTKKCDYAMQTLMNTHVDSEPAAPNQDDQRAARQTEAQRLQQRQEEQERERQNSLNRDSPDLDM